MRSRLLIAYQLLTGFSDTSTGILLIFAPGLTLHLMQLHVPDDALPFLSFIGAFVLSVGIACLYGGWLATRSQAVRQLETVWLLTAITRGSISIFVFSKILTGTLEVGWITVAVSDALCTLIQATGLYKGWLSDAAN